MNSLYNPETDKEAVMRKMIEDAQMVESASNMTVDPSAGIDNIAKVMDEIAVGDIVPEIANSLGAVSNLEDADIRALIGKADGVEMSFNEWYGASAGQSFTVTEGSDLFTSAAYYGFREERNPDVGSVSPTSLTVASKSHPIRDAYRRVSRSGGVDDDSTSAFWFIIYNSSDGTVPADDWFTSLDVEITGGTANLTPSTAFILLTAVSLTTAPPLKIP